ncbi:hypothetical protein OCK74_10115 [Chitinophagaceae bacterium LB-8]|uniref:Uncharacterized protein n=1 Tax=Paraflavisolibacter caeni TaxID=2982496 RepID=A0A9X3B7M9_9BACT|nr:hypothetical protein [Paraflavisolibacter caeni]MCU7549470.1 hypothetical protein [Paraflavisolibacter caeni]
MRKIYLLLIFTAVYQLSLAQKIESIAFNLYTDSLKKGFYNYISVDGRYDDGRWQPLDSSSIIFSANAGYFKGNDLFIDSSYKCDSIIVKAALRSNPAIWKEVIIYIRKRPFNEPLKTSQEVLDEIRKPRKAKKNMV